MVKGEKFLVYYHPDAFKELNSLKTLIKTKIKEKITLLEYPYKSNAIKLKGEPDTFRIREGQYRIVFKIYKPEKIVVIIKIGLRKNVYKR